MEQGNEDRKKDIQLEDVKEEFAADFAYSDPNVYARSEAGRHISEVDMLTSTHDDVELEARSSSNLISFTGIVFAVASWFIWPILMAIAAIVLGFLAYSNENKKWSSTAIGLGTVTIIYQFIIVPIYYSIL
ncbi:hypothetical protein ACFSTH_05045 [Paenibacillus yanchengensis]|uniref:DUF4190 domain-containing protein n=1 Tax=Paenibacillus yanchengensis TaxID=2035833 RepID=A0ABW4YKS9_9BACL